MTSEETPPASRVPAKRGRGTAENPANRFEEVHVERDLDVQAEDQPKTVYLSDRSRSILVENDSPDTGFRVGVNPYRGCEHGCAYCYARPYHEYLGFSAGLDFETKILVKEDAPQLLEEALFDPRWKPERIGMSGVTDPYQPIEKKLRLTRSCLEVLARFQNPVSLITKNRLIARDVDLLGEMAAWQGAIVTLSVTTLDAKLGSALEPRTSRPQGRLEAIARLADAGVPVVVNVAPVIPGLTDHEIPAILQAAADAGARWGGYEMLRLPHGVKDLFVAWLERHRPLEKEKVVSRIREVRGGRLNDPRFGTRMRGEGQIAEHLRALFEAGRRKAGLRDDLAPISTEHFRRPPRGQLSLW